MASTEALSRDCLDCGARVGEPCVSPSGEPYQAGVYHWLRRTGRTRRA